VSVGFHSAMSPEDKLITSYRCHPFAVLRGGTITGVLAELLGRQAGMSHGKGGSMHIFTPTFFGGNGIVGAQVPVGAGIAFADKYKKKDTVTFTLYGDGAANQGQVFESFNIVGPHLSIAKRSLTTFCRLSYGTFLASSCARTTCTVWVPQPSAALPTPSITPAVT